MYNFRQLVILIVSVFISLGLGIAVGFSANTDKVLVEQQQITIDKLEKDFTLLKAENRKKQLELTEVKEKYDSNLALFDEVFEVLTENILDMKKVSVIGVDEKIPPGVQEFLRRTGAQVYCLSSEKILGQKDLTDELPLVEETSTFAKDLANAQIYNKIQAELFTSDIYFILGDIVGTDILVEGLLEEKVPIAVIGGTRSNKISDSKSDLLYIENIEDPLDKYRLMAFMLRSMQRD